MTGFWLSIKNNYGHEGDDRKRLTELELSHSLDNRNSVIQMPLGAFYTLIFEKTCEHNSFAYDTPWG